MEKKPVKTNMGPLKVGQYEVVVASIDMEITAQMDFDTEADALAWAEDVKVGFVTDLYPEERAHVFLAREVF